MSPSTEGTLEGRGGVPIHWRRWDPPGEPRGVVAIVHGYAEHIGRYEHVARHLNGAGLAVAGIDHRGHGRSGGPRGHCLDIADYVADVRALVALAERWWPERRRFLLAHSLGGLIGLHYLCQHPDTMTAGMLSAPALRVSGQRFRRRLARALGRWFPRLRFRSNLDADALSRDPEVGRAYVADPLVHRAATAGFVRAVETAQEQIWAAATRLQVPVLIMQGDADRVVDATAAGELAGRLRGVHELLSLRGYYHELLNEPPSERARVLQAMDAWVARWLSA